jgi:hypothetical protein
MIMFTSKSSLRVSCLVLAFVAGPGLAACSSDDSQSRSPLVAERSGRMALALSTRGASGSLYRLRQADFFVSQQSSDPSGGFATFLSSEEDPLASTLEATLPAGDYSVELFFGWTLEKVEAGEAVTVDARLLSPALQLVSILPDEESPVSYRFETEGEIITFEQGRLVIDIEVEEQGPAVLGEPLEIVDGAIAAGSNELGIAAELFSVTSERNATLEVTQDTGELCVSGVLDPVLDGDFATQWGAIFGLTFLASDGEATPWDRAGGSVDGFAFTIKGPAIPPMRFGALAGDGDAEVDSFCAPFIAASGDTLEISIDELTRDCWIPGGEPLITPTLANIIWNMPTDTFSTQEYDFCIGALRPILR